MKADARWACVGNVHGSKRENTHCPSCGELLMRRGMGRPVESRLGDDSRCACGARVPMRA